MNKYANLVGTNKIKDEYTKINTGFDKVETDINTLDARVDTIITTPIEGEEAAQEIVDARVSAIKSKTFTTLDARLEETEQDVATHKAEIASDTKLGHVLADKYVLLWSGNVNTAGEITLLSSCAGIYNGFVIQTGAGDTTMQYFVEYPSGNKIALSSAANVLTYYTFSGAGRLIGVDATGLKLNLAVTGGQPLRAIYGIVRGTVIR